VSLVLDLKPCDHVTPALYKLHWLPIGQQIEYKLCLLAHKSLIGHAPDYVTDPLTDTGRRHAITFVIARLQQQQPPSTDGAVIRWPCVLCGCTRCAESATDRTETRVFVDNNIKASPKDILIQLSIHLSLTGMYYQANCSRWTTTAADTVNVNLIPAVSLAFHPGLVPCCYDLPTFHRCLVPCCYDLPILEEVNFFCGIFLLTVSKYIDDDIIGFQLVV